MCFHSGFIYVGILFNMCTYKIYIYFESGFIDSVYMFHFGCRYGSSLFNIFICFQYGFKYGGSEADNWV